MQFNLVLALIFALIVAIFSINNPSPVPIRFMFWSYQAPLVIVILGSAVFGAVVVFLLGVSKQYSLIRKVKSLERDNKELEKKLGEKEEVIEKSEASENEECPKEDVSSKNDIEESVGEENK